MPQKSVLSTHIPKIFAARFARLLCSCFFLPLLGANSAIFVLKVVKRCQVSTFVFSASGVDRGGGLPPDNDRSSLVRGSSSPIIIKMGSKNEFWAFIFQKFSRLASLAASFSGFLPYSGDVSAIFRLKSVNVANLTSIFSVLANWRKSVF